MDGGAANALFDASNDILRSVELCLCKDQLSLSLRKR